MEHKEISLGEVAELLTRLEEVMNENIQLKLEIERIKQEVIEKILSQ